MKEDGKQKSIKVLILFLILIILIGVVFTLLFNLKKDNKGGNTIVATAQDNKYKEEKTKPKKINSSSEIEVVPTLLDNISSNSAWCATFQLVWNDMQNEVVKKDIIFNKQLEIVENLNRQSFKEEDISDSYYYKKFGLFTIKLKDEIEKGIKDKFDQDSDIIDLLDWSNAPKEDSFYKNIDKKYLFYTMLYKKFNFEKEFEELDKGTFNGSEKEYKDIEYFGIDYSSSEELYSQVYVLYYNSSEDYAVILNTKEGDKVLLCKGDNGNNYKDIYDNIQKQSNEYNGYKEFTENDTLKVPNIKFDLLKEFEDLEENGDKSKIFYNYKNDECYINKALQTIKFELTKSGGEIKSEAAILMTEGNSIMLEPGDVEYRNFNFDSTFTIFLVEDGKDKPYFAANIDDITLFQK